MHHPSPSAQLPRYCRIRRRTWPDPQHGLDRLSMALEGRPGHLDFHFLLEHLRDREAHHPWVFQLDFQPVFHVLLDLQRRPGHLDYQLHHRLKVDHPQDRESHHHPHVLQLVFHVILDHQRRPDHLDHQVFHRLNVVHPQDRESHRPQVFQLDFLDILNHQRRRRHVVHPQTRSSLDLSAV